MTIKERIHANIVILRVALKVGKTPAQVRQDMQEALDEARSTVAAAPKAEQLRMFPKGKPTVEAFMIELSKQL